VAERLKMPVRRFAHVALAAAITMTLAVVSAPALAQPTLGSAKSLRCTFPRQATAAWGKEDAPVATTRSSSLVLRFEAIDTEAGTAQLRNGAVGSDVTVRFAEGYLHFMQAFRTGPLYTTTVFTAAASGGVFKAVHSRHELFATPVSGATSSPEQYYGQCEIMNR
jgi:hypothetical protein